MYFTANLVHGSGVRRGRLSAVNHGDASSVGKDLIRGKSFLFWAEVVNIGAQPENGRTFTTTSTGVPICPVVTAGPPGLHTP